MSRQRRIDVRFWNDEKVADLDPLDRLMFLYLMTTPLSTPIGIMVIPPSTLVDAVMPRPKDVTAWLEAGTGDQRVLGNADPTAFLDREGFGERLAIRSIERLKALDLLWCEKALFCVPKFLEYCAPDNPNILKSFLHAVEELPRSPIYARLRDMLRERGKIADWLFDLLLDPLADQEHRTLSRTFDARWRAYCLRVGKPIVRGTQQRIGKPFHQPSGEGSLEPPSKQDQDQGQGQDTTSADRRGSAASPSILYDNPSGKLHGITDAQVQEWGKTFPGLDVPGRIGYIEAWLKANPAKRYKNYHRFIVNWLKGDHSTLMQHHGGGDKVADALRGRAPMTQEVIDLLGGDAYFGERTKT